MKLEDKILNICLMCPNISYAGAQTQMIELAKNLDKKKFNVRICSFKTDFEISDELKREIGHIDIIQREFKYDIISFVFKIVKYLRKYRIDILYTFLPFANYFGLVAGKLSRVSVIITSERSSEYKMNYIHKKMKLTTVFGSDCMIANSVCGGNFIKNISPKSFQSKIQVVYNGSSKCLFSDDLKDIKQIQIPDGFISICLIARFKPAKNHRMFFMTAKKILEKNKKLIFICVGDYFTNQKNYYEELMKWYSELGINDNVIFLGERHDVPNILAQTDISVLTSDHEGLSNTLIESMMIGCPVVVTDVSDNKIIVEDGINGYVVPVNDVSAMAEKLDILVNDSVLRKQMGEENKKKAIQLFSTKRMVEETENIFYEMINKKTTKYNYSSK